MTTDDQVKTMLQSLGLPVKPCGLNADWCVSAWHLSQGTPNINSGDRYLLDTETDNEQGETLYDLVQRFYTAEDSDDNDNVQVIWSGMTLTEIEDNLRTVIAEGQEVQ